MINRTADELHVLCTYMICVSLKWTCSDKQKQCRERKAGMK